MKIKQNNGRIILLSNTIGVNIVRVCIGANLYHTMSSETKHLRYEEVPNFQTFGQYPKFFAENGGCHGKKY